MKKLALYVLLLASNTTILPTVWAEPANLDLLRAEIVNYHDSGKYEHELQKVTNNATKYINKRSVENSKKKNPQKLAIVLDIDETSLSNYKYMVPRKFVGTSDQFTADVMDARAPALKPMLSLFNNARQKGVAIFFVTGRHESEKQATVKNLHRAGYNNWAGLYLKPNNYKQKSIVPFKSKTRKMITDKGYTILASLGDQQSDLDGGYAEKTYKLPNPFYYLP